jgi:hypothetical protein
MWLRIPALAGSAALASQQHEMQAAAAQPYAVFAELFRATQLAQAAQDAQAQR